MSDQVLGSDYETVSAEEVLRKARVKGFMS